MIAVDRFGQRFRVQFVHSAHNLKESRGDINPGGLRQIVDNIAGSLHRRVSLAEIARIEEVPLMDEMSPVTSYVPVAQGLAVCHWTDNFIKSDGRAYSLYRALKNARSLSTQTKDDLA